MAKKKNQVIELNDLDKATIQYAQDLSAKIFNVQVSYIAINRGNLDPDKRSTFKLAEDLSTIEVIELEDKADVSKIVTE